MRVKLLTTSFVSLILSLLLADLVSASLGQGGCKRSGEVQVKGYARKNGRYVKPACRTKPNKIKKDNWSTIGNVNPYTGKQGTKTPQSKT